MLTDVSLAERFHLGIQSTSGIRPRKTGNYPKNRHFADTKGNLSQKKWL